MRFARMVKGLWKRKFVIISFYVSLLMPAYCFSSARSFQIQLASLEFEGWTSTWYSSIDSRIWPKEIMLKAKGQWNMGSFRVSASAEEFSVEQKILYSIKGIGGDISDWNMDICEGEMFSEKDVQNEKRVCLLSENFMELNDYDIGDFF
ncbi:hypothetical protein M2145_002802 [Lachnospiraceae bacterium PF1-21]